MRPNTIDRRASLSSPAVQLAVVLAIALALRFAPQAIGQATRDYWREALRPGQIIVRETTEIARSGLSKLRTPDAAPADADQIARLNEQVRQLQAELLMKPSLPNSTDADSGAEPPKLLVTQTIGARVLGKQSKAYLQSREMLDVGRTSGVAAKSLVVDSPARGAKDDSKTSPDDVALLDQGRDARVQAGRFVLAGRRIWGKVADVGLHTCTVQRITDAGYRDLVQLASRQDGRLQFAARGVLVGKGEALCKIELVDATSPVMAGDLVYTVSDGALDTPLLYGRVARIERKPGAAHWEIWMEPAVSLAAPPERVAVLKTELSPSRFAER
jgi:cell shape-determining protein MreC